MDSENAISGLPKDLNPKKVGNLDNIYSAYSLRSNTLVPI